MNVSKMDSRVDPEHLWFFIVSPGETDVLFGAVAIGLVLIVLGFGALYFTIQAWPDRLAKGVGKAQLQVVGILGLISLLTMNNLLWVIALVLAAIRIPDIVTPLKDISRALRSRPDGTRSDGKGTSPAEAAPGSTGGLDAELAPIEEFSSPASDAISKED